MKTLGSAAGATLAWPWLQTASGASHLQKLDAFREVKAEDLAQDEDFWHLVRQAYTSSPNYINLNSGGVSPHTRQVAEAVQAYTRNANEAPALVMWRSMRRERKSVRRRLALMAGCSPEEIAIQRNTTEALNAIMLGIDFQPGDEIVTSDQVYPSMDSALKQLEKRKGIIVKRVPLPVPAPDMDALAQAFENAISSSTRLVLVCHMINLTGQIMPVKRIADYAHANGAEVLVDGAHTFGHFPFHIPDLGCDYFGTSLHKWLCAPYGTGMLYVKKEKIKNVWPIFGAPDGEEELITKFEHLGTRSFPTELAISHALDFHNMIGGERKAARLRYLRNYWTSRVADLPAIRFMAKCEDAHTGSIANFSIEGKEARKIGDQLLREFNIYTTTTNHKDVKGVRISPNVFTSLEELDELVRVIKLLVV